MSSAVFLSAVNRVVDRDFSLAQVIDTATVLDSVGETDQGRRLYDIWLSFNSDDPMQFVARFNSAVAASKVGNYERAREGLELLIAEKPDFAPAYINLGIALEKLGRLDEAIQRWSELVIRLDIVKGDAVNHKLTALRQMCRILTSCHRYEDAENLMRCVLDIDKNDGEVSQQLIAIRMLQCKQPVLMPWGDLDRRTVMRRVSPLSLLAYSDDPLFQLASADIYNTAIVGFPSVNLQADRKPDPVAARGRRLRVGYLSSDLRDHAIGYLMVDLFETHHREDFEVFAYYCGPPNDSPLRKRIEAAVEHWTNITGLDDISAARKILADDLDILVDVNGYTRDARSALVALRPAPVIVNWLGYPGTVGSPYHHYIVADEWIIPPGAEKYYSEKVVRLPCYQPSDRKREVAALPTRRQAGLPEDAFVYCCFNGSQKINAFMFDRWMTILREVPDSVLWLLSVDEAVNARLRERAEQSGVAAARLVFAEKTSNPEHLARHHLADLFLDTAPYGAHTTANDALWMGVPILTKTGHAFAARVCGSLVRAAGVPELICDTFEDYVRSAIDYGRDRERLRAIREKLKQCRISSILFNVDLLVGELEKLYMEMREKYLDGNLPCPDLTNLDFYYDATADIDREVVELSAVRDYERWYGDFLAKRHRIWPRRADNRMWTEADITRFTTVGNN